MGRTGQGGRAGRVQGEGERIAWQVSPLGGGDRGEVQSWGARGAGQGGFPEAL